MAELYTVVRNSVSHEFKLTLSSSFHLRALSAALLLALSYKFIYFYRLSRTSENFRLTIILFLFLSSSLPIFSSFFLSLAFSLFSISFSLSLLFLALSINFPRVQSACSFFILWHIHTHSRIIHSYNTQNRCTCLQRSTRIYTCANTLDTHTPAYTHNITYTYTKYAYIIYYSHSHRLNNPW